MKINKIAGICILIPILLSGCGSKSDTQTAAASTSQPQQTAKAADGGQANQQNRPAMDPAQRQLFITFQMLMQLDKADGMTITKEQAQAMLPVAQDIETKKELSDENKTKLLASLTDAQKTYMTDLESRMGNRGNGGFGGQNGQAANGDAQTGGKGNANGGGGRNGGNGNANGSGGQNGGNGNGNANGGGGQNGGNGNANGGGGQNGGNGNANGGSFGGNGGNRPAGGQMGDPTKSFVELLQTKLK